MAPELRATAGPAVPLDAQQAAAEAAVPGGAVVGLRQGADGRASMFTLDSGEVVVVYGYGDYTPVAKAVSRGIALHEGRAFGGFSKVMAAAFCLGVIALCITGPVMWTKRRPRCDGIAAPRGRTPIRATP